MTKQILQEALERRNIHKHDLSRIMRAELHHLSNAHDSLLNWNSSVRVELFKPFIGLFCETHLRKLVDSQFDK